MGKEDRAKEKFPGFRKPTYPMMSDELFDWLLADLKGGRR